MARDGNGRDHKAAGRPDGGQYEEKAGQGLDDDLEEVPTTAESVAPDEGWWASLENNPEAAAGPEAGAEWAGCRNRRGRGVGGWAVVDCAGR